MTRQRVKRSPAILIGGCAYGAGNIGDEGILSGLLAMIRQVAPNARIGVLAVDPKEVRRMHDVEAWPRDLSYRLFQTMRQFDVFLCGGATLADDSLGKGYPIRRCVSQILMARLLGLRVMITAIGANRFRTREGAFWVRFCYGTANRITVRDAASRDVLVNVGIKREIVVSADPAFLVEPDPLEIGNRALTESGIILNEQPLVGVSVVNEKYGMQKEYKRAIAAACDALIEERNVIPVFVSHDMRPEYDIVAVNETLSYMKHRQAAKILQRRFYSPSTMLSVISHFEMALGMRMHFLIFAASVGVPFAALSRVDKVDNFCSLFGLRPLASVENARPEPFARAVLDQYDRRSEMAAQLPSKHNTLKSAAMRTGDVLAHLLQEVRERNNG